MTADQWIRQLDLKPHPEGGYYRETYRAAEAIDAAHLPGRFGGRRSFSTAIYFLLAGDAISALHRIKSDEVWHFYAGSALEITVIHPDGRLETIPLGANPEASERPQAVVPAGCWFGSRLKNLSAYALAGCTVAPGFDFADFEMGSRDALLKEYPQHGRTIHSLTRS